MILLTSSLVNLIRTISARDCPPLTQRRETSEADTRRISQSHMRALVNTPSETHHMPKQPAVMHATGLCVCVCVCVCVCGLLSDYIR